jgi:hypothetical protein
MTARTDRAMGAVVDATVDATVDTVNRRDVGAVPVLELVLLTPVVFAVLGFVVLCGRVAEASGSVQDAARAAARAASLRADPDTARADAADAAARRLARRVCPHPEVVVDADLRPGGRVEAAVTCTVPLRGLGLPGAPGSFAVSARSVEIVDRFRAGRP